VKFRVIVRRLTSYGGAEVIAFRFAKYLHTLGLLEEVVCGRNEIREVAFKVKEVGFLRPGRFLKTYSFQRRVLSYLKRTSNAVNFTFSKVPNCHVFRDGGGTHCGFLKFSIDAYSFPRNLFKRLSRLFNPINYYNPLLESRIFLTSRKILAISELVKEEILEYYNFPGLEDRIEVIPNPVDKNRFNKEVKEQLRCRGRELVKAENGDFIVGFASSNFWLKGLHLLIKALVLLPKNIKLVIAGGRSSKRFLQLAKKLGVEKRVFFLGKVNNMELFYSGIDLLAHPSYYDTFGNVITEALAMGIPVICSNRTGAKDFVKNGVNGFVLSSFSPDEIAEAIYASLGKNWDFTLNLPSDEEVFREYVRLGEQSLSPV